MKNVLAVLTLTVILFVPVLYAKNHKPIAANNEIRMPLSPESHLQNITHLLSEAGENKRYLLSYFKKAEDAYLSGDNLQRNHSKWMQELGLSDFSSYTDGNPATIPPDIREEFILMAVDLCTDRCPMRAEVLESWLTFVINYRRPPSERVAPLRYMAEFARKRGRLDIAEAILWYAEQPLIPVIGNSSSTNTIVSNEPTGNIDASIIGLESYLEVRKWLILLKTQSDTPYENKHDSEVEIKGQTGVIALGRLAGLAISKNRYSQAEEYYQILNDTYPNERYSSGSDTPELNYGGVVAPETLRGLLGIYNGFMHPTTVPYSWLFRNPEKSLNIARQLLFNYGNEEFVCYECDTEPVYGIIALEEYDRALSRITGDKSKYVSLKALCKQSPFKEKCDSWLTFPQLGQSNDL